MTPWVELVTADQSGGDLASEPEAWNANTFMIFYFKKWQKCDKSYKMEFWVTMRGTRAGHAILWALFVAGIVFSVFLWWPIIPSDATTQVHFVVSGTNQSFPLNLTLNLPPIWSWWTRFYYWLTFSLIITFVLKKVFDGIHSTQFQLSTY